MPPVKFQVIYSFLLTMFSIDSPQTVLNSWNLDLDNINDTGLNTWKTNGFIKGDRNRSQELKIFWELRKKCI